MPFLALNLSPQILLAVRHAGYMEPTPIQLAAIPPILAGHDLIGTAQTGTGKTAEGWTAERSGVWPRSHEDPALLTPGGGFVLRSVRDVRPRRP